MSTLTRSRSSIILLISLLAALLLLSGCGGGGGNEDRGSSAGDDTAQADDEDEPGSEGGGTDDEVAARDGAYDAAPSERLATGKTYTVEVTTSKGVFDIVLDQKAGPIAASNFAFLVREGFYDGVVFHRVIRDFMVQTGDPTGSGSGGPGYSIKDDKVTGNYSRGTVAMANAGPNTGGSQFFIVHGTNVNDTLGKDYAMFGRVDKAGMKVIDKIASVEVTTGPNGELSMPTETVKIEKMELRES